MKRYPYKVACEHFAFGLGLSISVVWQLSRGLTLGQASLIEATALATRFVLDIPTGHLSDRLGRKPTLVSASLFFGLGYWTLSQAHTFSWFLIAALLSAIGFALMSGSEEAFIYEAAPSSYRQAYSRLTVIDEAATIAGLLASALIVKLLGLQASLIAAAVMMAITVVVGLIVISEPRRKHLSKSTHSTLSDALSSSRQLLRTHLPLIGIFICLAVYNETGRVLWQPRLAESGLALQYLGLVFALFKFASLVGAYLARRQRTANTHRELVFIGCLLSIALGLMTTPILFVVIIGFIAYFLLENIYRISQSHYLQKLAPDNERATLLSTAGFFRSGYSIATLPLLGLLSQGGHTSIGFALLLALQIIATVSLFALAKQPNSSAAPS